VSNLDLRKGSVELLLLTLLTEEPRHGYEIGKLIEARSGGRIQYRVSSLYPVLCRLEERGWISGKWVERAGERRRRFYRLTAKGARALEAERQAWKEFTIGVRLIVEADSA
jgi:PadR family transcriptional regulator PadR